MPSAGWRAEEGDFSTCLGYGERHRVTSLERILDIVHFHLGARHSEDPLMLKTWATERRLSNLPAAQDPFPSTQEDDALTEPLPAFLRVRR